MKTIYLNMLLFAVLIATFICLQLSTQNWINMSVSENATITNIIYYKLLNIVILIPLAYSGAALFSTSAIKTPYLIIGLIDLGVVISVLQKDLKSFHYYCLILTAVVLGSLIALGVARLLRYNSKRIKDREVDKNSLS